MLQYAAPNAPHQTFQRPPSLFTDPPPSNANNSYNTRPPSSDTSQTLDSRNREYSFSGTNNPDTSIESQLPALAALASLAASAPAMNPPPRSNSGDSTRSSTPSTQGNMASAPFAPAATAGGTTQNSPPVCGNCQTSTTPLWRRDESGSVLCNACGLFLKLHGRPRPISLKTDVIKSRNRVKTAQPKKRDSHGGQDGLMHTNGHTASYPDGSHVGMHAHSHGLPMGMGEQQPRIPSPGSGSRSQTPAMAQQQNPNIAPQHIFDTVSLPSDTFASPSLPPFGLRNPSPAPSALNGGPHHGDHSQSYEAIINHNNSLRTRVSELEVINDLFRGRVAELESSEQAARRNEGTKDEEARKLRADLAAATARAADLERRLAELETEGPARKKSRTDAGPNEEDESVAAPAQLENGVATTE